MSPAITTNANKRIVWVDTIRGIAIFCVLVLHQQIDTPLFKQFYAPFFMPVFFFVSGYLFKYKGIKENLKRIARGLLWPYVAFSYISRCAAPVFIRNIQAGTALSYLAEVTHNMLLGKTFWFIACLIVAQVVYTFLSASFSRTNNNWKKVVAIIGLLFIYVIRREETAYLPWHIDTACFAIGFFALGDLFKSINITAITGNKKWRIASWGILALYIATTIFLNWEKYGIDIDLNCNRFHNTTLSLFLIVFGCFTLILFSICNNFSKFINKLGANTLVVYCLHGGFGIGVSSVFFGLIGINSWCPSPYIHVLLVAILASIIMLIIAHIINKYLPFLLGKPSRWFGTNSKDSQTTRSSEDNK